MRKLIVGILALVSISAYAAIDYSIECYVKTKCPENSHCEIRELVVFIANDQAESVIIKSGRKSVDVENFSTSRNGTVKISGKDAYGDSFSAKINLMKVLENEDYSDAGRFNILRVYPVKLACRKL